MKKYKIRLNTINDASLFTAKCNEYKDVDIDCLYGKKKILKNQTD